MNLSNFGMDTITLAGSLEHKLDAIRRAGFTQVMLSARDLSDHPDGVNAAVAAVRRSGLRVTGLQVLRDYEGLPGHLHAYKVDIAKAMIELCRAVDAKLVLVCSSTSVHSAGEPGKAAADLAKLATLAIPSGIRVAYEALSWGRHVNEYPQAWDIVERAGVSNLGLAIDSFHLIASGTSLDELDFVFADRIFFVQLADFMWQEVPSPEDRRETARHFRVFPGEGVHGDAVATLARKLDRLGYRGDFSFEVFNDDYLQIPADRVASRARQAAAWVMSQVARRSLPMRTRTGPVRAIS
ncbi:MAG TPA: sugar phosphate isomerase/epimerase [Casimicrobiaceae bacterium]|nr:sugar phosphate isomerase/epimerase [Casimicrobiaceae bacterium]